MEEKKTDHSLPNSAILFLVSLFCALVAGLFVGLEFWGVVIMFSLFTLMMSIVGAAYLIAEEIEKMAAKLSSQINPKKD